MSALDVLPVDAAEALLIGRLWDADARGPRVVLVDGAELVDVGAAAGTVSGLLERADAASAARGAASDAPRRWPLEEVLTASVGDPQSDAVTRLLAPVDLQVIKACGVTFADSMLERLIEERAGGDLQRAASVRAQIEATVGADIATVTPGSPEALTVKDALIQQGMWSQYLEVGIGPDPEVFTKAPVLSSVGYGARIGVPAFSSWNNPEPELVLVVDSSGLIRGATLGNDVNLRDVEGRSALLLGMAKDNNGSTAIGPFIRLFDDGFTLDALRTAEIGMTVTGADGYELAGRNSLARISRPFERLVAATHGAHHQYPDGFALFTGTLFAPTEDRDEPGHGFTHKLGDQVRISSPLLGTLSNEVGRSEELPPWIFGVGALAAWLARAS